MKPIQRFIHVGVLAVSLAAGSLHAAPLGEAFTYSGRLTDGGVPATGLVPMTFTLHAAASGGDPLTPSLPLNVPVTNGLFTVDLEFGAGAFTGEARWLRITVNGTPLTPRQPLAPTPYAIRASTANAVPAAAITAPMLLAGGSDRPSARTNLRTGRAARGDFLEHAARGELPDQRDAHLDHGGRADGQSILSAAQR